VTLKNFDERDPNQGYSLMETSNLELDSKRPTSFLNSLGKAKVNPSNGHEEGTANKKSN